MTREERFKDAQARVHSLKSRPSNARLLELYGLFKQATAGDVSGPRPGLLDPKGRAKYDAWAGRKGLAREAAMQAYVDLVDLLLRS